MKEMAVLAIALIGIAATLNWRKSVHVVLVLVVLEGAIRKWLLPSVSEYVYFLKDLILLGAYVGYFLRGNSGRTRLQVPAMFQVALGLSGTVVLAQSLNPNLGSPLIGAVGSKGYLFYIPLCFMVADLFRTPQELQRFLKGYLVLAVPVCLLGVAQFFAPTDSPINTYVLNKDEASVMHIASFGEENRARITGTFSYIAGHTTYTLIVMGLTLVMWAHASQFKWRLVYLATLLLLMANMLMTGSRAPVFSAAILIVLFALVAVQGRSKQERRTVFALIGASMACVLASVFLFSEATDAFVYRTYNSDSATERATIGFLQPFDYLEEASFSGYGAGATQPGAQALANAFDLPPPAYEPPPSEQEPLRVLLEIGTPAFFLWYWMRICLLWLLWRTYKKLKTPWLRHLALVSCLIHAIYLPNPVVLNPTMNVYYWFLSGFIFLLPRLERAAHAPAPTRRLRPIPGASTVAPPAPRRTPSRVA